MTCPIGPTSPARIALFVANMESDSVSLDPRRDQVSVLTTHHPATVTRAAMTRAAVVIPSVVVDHQGSGEANAITVSETDTMVATGICFRFFIVLSWFSNNHLCITGLLRHSRRRIPDAVTSCR